MFLVPGEQFAQLLEEEPVINAHLLRFLCRRVRQTSQQVEDVAFLSMGQRLARQLHLLASAQMENFAGRGVKVSQNDLASLVSASRQNVNSALQEWQRQGFITVFRGRIEIHDFESLFNYVERLE